MQDLIENRVYDLVAQERGVRRTKLRPNSTLSHDLGIEGDDAVEFFQDFAAKFSIDLRLLDNDWHCYFSSEGVGTVTMLLVTLWSMSVGYLIHLVVPAIPFWLASLIGFVATIGFGALWARKRHARGPQISIQDLIDCAKAGRWIKQPPSNCKRPIAATPSYGGLGRWFTS